MEILTLTELGVPLGRLVIYVFVITLCLFLGRTQLGLAVTFVFVFYLGFIYNYSFLREALQGSTLSLAVYFASGAVLLILALLSFFQSPD